MPISAKSAHYLVEYDVDQPFNPYAEWLGLAGVSQRPDHYALLGLDRFESGSEKIKQAADRATTRVRSFRPGAKARDWARLLDELDEARRCLSDAGLKSVYDDQLRSGGAQGAAVPPTMSATATVGPRLDPMYPPEQPRYGPAGPPPDDVPTPQPMAPVAAGNPALYAPGHTAHHESRASAPSNSTTLPVGPPRRVPMGRDAGAASPATGEIDPMAPVGMMSGPSAAEYDPMAPVAMPVGAAPSAVTMAMPISNGSKAAPIPLATAAPSGEEKSTAIATGDSQPRARSAGTSRNLLYAGGGAVVAATLGLAILFFFFPGDEKKPSGPEVAAGVGDIPRPSTTPSDVDDEPKVPIVDEPEVIVDPTPEPTPEPDPTPEPEPTPPIVTDPPPEPTPEPTPLPTPEPQPDPDPDPAPQPLTPEETKQLAAALAGARAAMGQRDLDAVNKNLKTAESLARSDEHKAMVARLKDLRHYVQEFWRAVDEAYAGLKPSSTLTIGNDEAAIVEVRADVLIIRYFGQNRTIQRDGMPAGLAMAIANTWFNNDPANKVVKGAFLFVVPKGRPEETRRLWQEASDAGVDVSDLMPVLDDDYKF